MQVQAPAPCRDLSFRGSRPPRRACRCRSKSETRGAEDQQKPEFNLQSPTETVQWGGTLPSGRRAVLSGLAGLSIVLASNLGGVTGALLGADGGSLAGRLHLDVLYPVKGRKRCFDPQNGYEFTYPSQWLADQRLYQRAAERVERANALDPQPVRNRRRNVTEPTAAFGPAGSTGEENVSVIVAPIRPGFKLEDLGTAEQAIQRFLSTTVAPEGSDKQASLLSASSRRDGQGQLYYTANYTVKSSRFYRHNVSVYASRNGVLYTFNSQCPETRWEQERANLQSAAESFRVVKPNSSIPSSTGIPQRS